MLLGNREVIPLSLINYDCEQDPAIILNDKIREVLKGFVDTVKKVTPSGLAGEPTEDTPVPIAEVPFYFDGVCIKGICVPELTSGHFSFGTAFYLYHMNIQSGKQDIIDSLQFLGVDQGVQENSNNEFYHGLESLFYDHVGYSCEVKDSLLNGQYNFQKVNDVNDWYQYFNVYQNETTYLYPCMYDWFTPLTTVLDESSYCKIQVWGSRWNYHETYYPQYFDYPFVEYDGHGTSLLMSATVDDRSRHQCTTQYPLITNDANDMIITEIRNYGGNTYNYDYSQLIDNSHNITYYYGDQYIIMKPDSGDYDVTFKDVSDGLQHVVDQLNLILDSDTTLIIPTFDELAYEDMGDFYIEPLHQYEPLPHAPVIDGTLDLQDYPRAVGLFAGAYLDLIPAGLSVLMTGIFILAIILDNLRGRR